MGRIDGRTILLEACQGTHTAFWGARTRTEAAVHSASSVAWCVALVIPHCRRAARMAIAAFCATSRAEAPRRCPVGPPPCQFAVDDLHSYSMLRTLSGRPGDRDRSPSAACCLSDLNPVRNIEQTLKTTLPVRRCAGNEIDRVHRRGTLPARIRARSWPTSTRLRTWVRHALKPQGESLVSVHKQIRAK